MLVSFEESGHVLFIVSLDYVQSYETYFTHKSPFCKCNCPYFGIHSKILDFLISTCWCDKSSYAVVDSTEHGISLLINCNIIYCTNESFFIHTTIDWRSNSASRPLCHDKLQIG